MNGEGINHDQIILQTISWIKNIVIGCNFCPFAAKALLQNRIRYVVLHNANEEKSLSLLLAEMKLMDQSNDVETTLIILPDSFDDFKKYLELVDLAEALIAQEAYEGIYQVASFHPEYLFAGSNDEDPANYTNRSLYPMLHILREDSVTKAVDYYENIERIPKDNIAYARAKGLAYMQTLRNLCKNIAN